MAKMANWLDLFDRLSCFAVVAVFGVVTVAGFQVENLQVAVTSMKPVIMCLSPRLTGTRALLGRLSVIDVTRDPLQIEISTTPAIQSWNEKCLFVANETVDT